MRITHIEAELGVCLGIESGCPETAHGHKFGLFANHIYVSWSQVASERWMLKSLNRWLITEKKERYPPNQNHLFLKTHFLKFIFYLLSANWFAYAFLQLVDSCRFIFCSLFSPIFCSHFSNFHPELTFSKYLLAFKFQ